LKYCQHHGFWRIFKRVVLRKLEASCLDHQSIGWLIDEGDLALAAVGQPLVLSA
jgi:hypothetical protein